MFMGFQNASENQLHDFENLVMYFGKVLEYFWDFLKEFLRTLFILIKSYDILSNSF